MEKKEMSEEEYIRYKQRRYAAVMKWRKNHPEECREASRRYQEKHRDEVNKRNRERRWAQGVCKPNGKKYKVAEKKNQFEDKKIFLNPEIQRHFEWLKQHQK